MIIAKPFNGSLGKNMCKVAHPTGSVGSSNPHCWRGEQLCHHGDGVWEVFCDFCAISWFLTPQSGSLYVKNVWQHNLKVRLIVLLFVPHWLASYPLANCPIFFAAGWVQVSPCFGSWMSWLYVRYLPMSLLYISYACSLWSVLRNFIQWHWGIQAKCFFEFWIILQSRSLILSHASVCLELLESTGRFLWFSCLLDLFGCLTPLVLACSGEYLGVVLTFQSNVVGCCWVAHPAVLIVQIIVFLQHSLFP